ncbi:MAG: hypothetical protein HDT28_09220 [Clostridiales bacterium]|nr:hypothetical protein [Clostridiales bacterium]
MKGQKKLLIYKILLFAFAFFIAFMPSTATRSKEVNSRVIVEMLGIDGGDDGVSVTAQYIMPTEQKDGASKDTVTVTGDSLTLAVEALSTALGRRAELGHCSMVVVGEKATPEMLSALMTATDVTADVYMTAAEKEAKDFVSDVTEFMKKTGATDADFIAYGVKKAHVATNTLLSFLSDLNGASHTAFLPVVEMLEEGEGESGSGGGSQGGGSGGQQESSGGEGEKGGGSEGGGESKQTGMKVEKLAVYSNNERVAVLDKEAARGVAWVSAPIEKGLLVADVEYGGKTVEDVSARLLKKHVCVKIDKEHNIATVEVKAVIEPNGDKFNTLTAMGGDIEQAITSAFAESIKTELNKAYVDSRAVGCDPLFIGREFYRKAPDYYETEYNFYGVSVEFNIDVTIK